MAKKVTKFAFGRVCGMATIGPRGQVVIPKEARDKLRLKAGEQFLVIEHFGKIVLLPEKMMKEMVKHIAKHFS